MKNNSFLDKNKIFSTFGKIKPSINEINYKDEKVKSPQKGILFILNTILWITIGSFLTFVSYRFFVQAIDPGIRSMAGGISGISMLTGLLAFPNDLNKEAFVTFGSSIAFNIPFLIFGYLKVGKKFTLYSIYYLFVQFAVQLIIIFSPGVNEFITDHFLFPSSSSSLGNIDNQLRACLNAVIAGTLYGFSCVIVYNQGACAGGTDFVSFYINLKQNKTIGHVNFLINSAVVVIGVFILAIQQPVMMTSGVVDYKNTFINSGVRLIATFLYILVTSFVVDKYYPRQKIVNLTIILNDLEFLDISLKTLNIQRSYTYLTAVGAYSKKTKYMCHLIMTDYELKLFKKYLKTVNVPPEIFISVTYSQHIAGRFRALRLED